MSVKMTPIHGSTGNSPCGGAGERCDDWTISIPDGLGGDVGSAPAWRYGANVYDVPAAIAARIPRGGRAIIAGPGIVRTELWIYTRRSVRPGVVRIWCRDPSERRERFMFRTRRRA